MVLSDRQPAPAAPTRWPTGTVAPESEQTRELIIWLRSRPSWELAPNEIALIAKWPWEGDIYLRGDTSPLIRYRFDGARWQVYG